jgi:hypothetical protein
MRVMLGGTTEPPRGCVYTPGFQAMWRRGWTSDNKKNSLEKLNIRTDPNPNQFQSWPISTMTICD